MPVLPTQLNARSADFVANAAAMRTLVEDLNTHIAKMPARCLVVEDTVTGVTAGVAAGATVVGYSPSPVGHGTPEALRAAGAVQVRRT